MRKISFLLFVLLLPNLVINAQYVRRRAPIGLNVGAITDAMQTLSAQYQQLNSLKRQVIQDLSDVELNPMENEWKIAFINKVSNIIDSNTKDIGPADAIGIVQKIGQNAMSSQELVARYNANQDFVEFKEYVKTNKNSDFNITNCKKRVIDECNHYNVNISKVETYGGSFPALGDALYTYSLAILNKPRCYRDWLYLLFLSAKCGNSDAINQANDYRLLKDESMIRGHNTNLFY